MTGFLITVLSSCKKLDYKNEFAEFASVYFLNNSVISVEMQARYNGAPIEWNQSSGEIRAVAGEAKLEFYDRRTGAVQAEKTVTIDPSRPDTFQLFQPVEGGGVSFIDPKAQADEAAPPEGFMKIKIANYATDLVPFENTDLVVIGEYYDEDFNTQYEVLDTIYNVSQNLDNEGYHTVSKGGAHIGAWRFSFLDHETGQEVKNLGGTTYSCFGFYSSLYAKFIFTLYLTSYEEWGEHELFIKKGDKFYSVAINVLLED